MLSFKIYEEIRSFQDKIHLEKFMSTNQHFKDNKTNIVRVLNTSQSEQVSRTENNSESATTEYGVTNRLILLSNNSECERYQLHNKRQNRKQNLT